MRIRVLVGVCLLLILVCLPPSERGQETPAGGDFGEIHFAVRGAPPLIHFPQAPFSALVKSRQ